jgi:hypothetical protein
MNVHLHGGPEGLALDRLVLGLADELAAEVAPAQLEANLVPASPGAVLLLEGAGFS